MLNRHAVALGIASSGKTHRGVERLEDALAKIRVENTIPVLNISDLQRSIEFYRDVLGFEVEWNAGTVCSVARDQCSIMLQVQTSVPPSTVWIGLEGDSLFATIEQTGARIVQPPTNQPWAYEMKVADPDGNILWLGAEPRREPA